MGADAGFDMVPPLSNGALDRQQWDNFLRSIKEHYSKDARVEIKSNYIEFNAGEHPRLPFEGHKLLRFSSKITGGLAAASNVEKYLRTVYSIAKAHFGPRVIRWNELFDVYGHHDWKKVNDSLRSYEKPDDPEPFTSGAHIEYGPESVQDVGKLPFKAMELPGKGRGLVARIKIAKGTRILSEEPLMTAKSMPPALLEPLIVTKLKALSKGRQRQFLSLHNNYMGKNPFSGIFKTNALPCGFEAPIGGVYHQICLINHSCVPNCNANWNSDTGHETIYATQDIEAGEEITILYKQEDTFVEQRAVLGDAFGFDCNCTRCSSSALELRAGDIRRLQIKKLDDAIGDPGRMLHKPKESLADCQSLLQLIEAEYSGSAEALKARVYYDAFQLAIAHGDQARAIVLAERAYKVRVFCDGEDSPSTKKIKLLASKPTDHGSFEMASKRWRLAKKMVPKGLDAISFEKWLFRE